MGTNIYTIENVILAAVGFAWYEGWLSMTNAQSPLEQWIFVGAAISSSANLFLCTLPLNSTTIQRHFFVIILTFWVAYTYVVSLVTSQSDKVSEFTIHANASSNYTLSQASALYFLGDEPPLDPLLPYIRIGGCLAIISVQTLVAAAATAPNLWDSRITGPSVITAVVLCSQVRECCLSAVWALTVAVILTVATKIDINKNEKNSIMALVVTVLHVTAQIMVIGVEAYMIWRLLTADASLIGPLIVGGVSVGISFLSSLAAFIASLLNLKSAVDVFQSLKIDVDIDTQTYRLRNSITPAHLIAHHTLRAVVPSSEVGTLQTAFHTSEANLFRPNPTSAQWGPKKTS